MLAIAFDFASVDADESPGSGPNGEDVFAVQSGRSVRMGVYATADSPTELGGYQLNFEGSDPNLLLSNYVTNFLAFPNQLSSFATGTAVAAGSITNPVVVSDSPLLLGSFNGLMFHHRSRKVVCG
jgi:hypothetical protein